MKGSPAKMGKIQGAAGHRSALKAMEEKSAMKRMKEAAAMKAMKEDSAMKAMKKDSPADFNAELKQASADGKLSGKFKEAVDAAPTKMMRPKDKKSQSEQRKENMQERSEAKKGTGHGLKVKGGSRKPSPAKEKALPSYSKAYSKMEDAEGGGKKDKYGRTYKDEAAFTKAAKAYNEKKYATTEPSKDSKKAGQTRAELAKAHTKTTTKNVKTVKKDGEDVVIKKGAGSKKGKTLTAQEKSKERLKLDQAKKSIKDAKKSGDKDARDRAQLEKAEIKSGRDDKYTGTMLSRAIARAKVRKNKRQLERRAKKNEDKA